MFAVDYRGYGVSTGTPTERGLYRDVDAAVQNAWPAAAADVPLVYWGRSLGASMAAYGATVRKPDGVHIRFVGPSPAIPANAAEPELEDAFLYLMNFGSAAPPPALP